MHWYQLHWGAVCDDQLRRRNYQVHWIDSTDNDLNKTATNPTNTTLTLSKGIDVLLRVGRVVFFDFSQNLKSVGALPETPEMFENLQRLKWNDYKYSKATFKQNIGLVLRVSVDCVHQLFSDLCPWPHVLLGSNEFVKYWSVLSHWQMPFQPHMVLRTVDLHPAKFWIELLLFYS